MKIFIVLFNLILAPALCYSFDYPYSQLLEEQEYDRGLDGSYIIKNPKVFFKDQIVALMPGRLSEIASTKDCEIYGLTRRIDFKADLISKNEAFNANLAVVLYDNEGDYHYTRVLGDEFYPYVREVSIYRELTCI